MCLFISMLRTSISLLAHCIELSGVVYCKLDWFKILCSNSLKDVCNFIATYLPDGTCLVSRFYQFDCVEHQVYNP